MDDVGGVWWVMIDIVAVAVLGLALAYGTTMWRKRRARTTDAARDAATDRLYGKQ